MKVSIITVVRNNRATIAQVIKSVLDQDHKDIEYIIVDGESNDGTQDVIKRYEHRITKWVSEPDKGIYDAMNKGLKMVTGEVVGFLNSDDFYTNTQVISKVVRTLRKNKAQAVYGDLVYISKDQQRVLRYWKSGAYRPGYFRLGWMPPHPTFFVKKEIYDQHGSFDTRLRSAADYELMLRFIHRFKIKLAYIPEIIVKMRIGGQSNASVKNYIKANKEDREAWRLNGYTPNFFTWSMKPLRKLSQFLMKPNPEDYIQQEELIWNANQEVVYQN